MKKLTLLLLFLSSNLFAFTQTNFDIALRDFENNNMAKYRDDELRLLFKTLQPLNKYFRWFLYVSTNIAFYFFINFMEKISISFIISYSFDPTFESIIISMFGFFKILSMVFMFGFFFLEFIIDLS